MRVLITGSRGFIGQNLRVRLNELSGFDISTFERGQSHTELRDLVAKAQFIFHLAGENRPDDAQAFQQVNAGLTQALCDAVRETGRAIPIVFTSTAHCDASEPQAHHLAPYAASKRAGEQAIEALSARTGNPGAIFRLPGVFGKWSRPNYNSVVSTFCHNVVQDLPLRIDAPAHVLRLVYIDDVMDSFLACLNADMNALEFGAVTPVHEITLGDLAQQIQAFKASRDSLVTAPTGHGLIRALHATYLSYLPSAKMSYTVPVYGDSRGKFVEFVKTHDSGQFSFMKVKADEVRGEHYHHSKTEKFLVASGTALFTMRNLATGEIATVQASDHDAQIVETVPGWVHNVANIGDGELVILIWANENFDRDKPDTIQCKV